MDGTSDDKAREREALGAGSGSWPAAADLLGRALRRRLWVILLAGLVGGGLGLAAKTLLPSRYTATAQVLIDPHGLKVFANDLTNGSFDANAAIAFVESQMGVVTSENVLSRVIRAEHLSDDAGLRDDAPAIEAPASDSMQLRPSLGPDGTLVDVRTLTALRRALKVQRAERSFVVDVTATARTPELAARLANAVVKAYTEEEAAGRGDAARRLTDDLTGRLDAMRRALRQSEEKAESYRADAGLTGSDDKPVIEQSLADANAALGTARNVEARARARAEQLEASAADRGAGAIGTLGADGETRTLVLLLERQAAAREDLARLATRLGDRHPALADARNRVDEIDRRVVGETLVIRKAARVDLDRARAARLSLERTVANLTTDVAQVRRAEIEMRALAQEVDANRKILAAFETRSREADAFGRIDSANLRIVSVARPPDARASITAPILWAIFGAILGMLVAVAAITLAAALGFGDGARREADRRRAAAAAPRVEP